MEDLQDIYNSFWEEIKSPKKTFLEIPTYIVSLGLFVASVTVLITAGFVS